MVVSLLLGGMAVGAAAQESPPPAAGTAVLLSAEAQAALRARVEEFWSLWAAGQRVKALELVAEDSRDAFVARPVPVVAGFRFDRIVPQASPDLALALVYVVSERKVSPPASEAPTEIPYATVWKRINAEWYLTLKEEAVGATAPELEKATLHTHHQDPDSEFFAELEMGSPSTGGTISLSAIRGDPEAVRRFAVEYHSAGPEKRPVFEKYLDALGTEAMLDFLEATYPFCHHQAHELGQAVYAKTKDVNAALNQCKTRCGTACMHGVLKEAFAGAVPTADQTELKKQMVGFCFDSEMTGMYQPGNCAHGTGHALLMLAGRDLGQAIAACSSFQNPAMEYYCATGVFMEYVGGIDDRELRTHSLHFPCDTYTRYPAACYRYHAFRLLPALGGDRARFVAECQTLPAPLRLGCFHGLGATQMRAMARAPELLAEVCRHGTAEEQTVCIEGAIEFLADYDQPKAIAACASLEGENAAVCHRAAREKRYRLDKPTLGLYLKQGEN